MEIWNGSRRAFYAGLPLQGQHPLPRNWCSHSVEKKNVANLEMDKEDIKGIKIKKTQKIILFLTEKQSQMFKSWMHT